MLREHLVQLEIFVGPLLHSLLRSREATEEHLDDSDPKLRFAALVLMTHRWIPTEQFKNKCEEMAFKDSDTTVRSTAIGCLGSCYARTDNRRVEKLLANIVCNEMESYEVRRSAYVALFIVKSVNSEHMITGDSFINLRIPEGVDWMFVRSMLT